MNGWMQLIFRGAALALGVFLTYCEVSGTYEYLMKDQGSLNYIVKAGIGVTIGTALLPVFAGMAWRAKKYARAAVLWLVFPLAVGVVFFAAIDRTGGTADIAQQQRIKDERARSIAVKTEAEATVALTTATEAANTECNSGPVAKRRGEKCLEAEAKRDAAQARVNSARAALLKAPVKETDPLAERIAAYTGHAITEEQVRLYRPLFLPLVLSILAGVFLSLGAHMDLPAPNPKAADEQPGEPEAIDPPASVVSEVLAPMQSRRGLMIAGVRLDHTPAEVVGDVRQFLLECLQRATGERVTLGAMYARYQRWCSEQVPAAAPVNITAFGEAFKALSARVALHTRREGSKIYLLDVKLVA